MERIVVKKVYVGGATKFGLLYGLIVGFLVTIIMLILLLTNIVGVSDVVGPASFIYSLLGLSDSMVYLLVFTFLFYTIVGVLVMFVGSLLYNLTSKLGGRLHLGLAEHVAPVKPIKFVKSGKETKTTPIKISNR